MKGGRLPERLRRSQRRLEGPAAERPSEAVWDPEAIVARVRQRELQRRPVLEAIATQARERAAELAGWGLERSWPFSRLREAWVVARHGPAAAANSGPQAPAPLYPDDYARLRRAVARYERNHTAAPDGYPAGGLAALLHLGALVGAGELPGGPRTLRYAVGALDQLSRRMRAIATADSAACRGSAAERARRRREPAPRALQLGFRAKWPPWVVTDHDGNPVFDRLGMLELDPDARCGVPPASSEHYRSTLRDAYLLAGKQLPVDVDGRKQMALRHQHQIPPAARRPIPHRRAARAGGTGAPYSRTRQAARPPLARVPPGVAGPAASGGGPADAAGHARVQSPASRRSVNTTAAPLGFPAARSRGGSVLTSVHHSPVCRCGRFRTMRRRIRPLSPCGCVPVTPGRSDRCADAGGVLTSRRRDMSLPRVLVESSGDVSHPPAARSPNRGCSRDDRATHSDRARARAPDAPRPCGGVGGASSDGASTRAPKRRPAARARRADRPRSVVA